MDKTFTINIAGTVFTIEQSAYEQLQDYLRSIKDYFAGYPDHEEIVADIEARVAENLTQSKAPGNVITTKQVDELIGAMGRVEDFAAANEEDTLGAEPLKSSQGAKGPKARKRLMRNPDDMVIAGVCSGLAAYVNIDPLIVRIIFLLSLFAGGGGIVLYLILWIVMPLAKTPSDKLQMRGDPLNLNTLEKNIKDSSAVHAAAGGMSSLRKFFSALFAVIGSVARVLIKVVVIAAGIVVAFSAAVAIIASTFTLANLIFNMHSQYINFPLAQVASSSMYYTIILLAYVIAMIPVVFLGMMALSLIGRRNLFNYKVSFSLLGLWFVALIVGGVVGLRVGPEYVEKIKQLPEYRMVTTRSDLKDFSSLEVHGSNNIELVQGENFSITATGRQIDMDRLELSVNNGTLIVSQKSGQTFCLFCINSFEGALIKVTMPKIDKIVTHGSADVNAGSITGDSLTVEMSGSSDAVLDIKVRQLNVEASGSTDLRLNGTATNIALIVSGSTDFWGEDLLVSAAAVTAKGSSSLYLNVSDTLNVEASGSSEVTYKGAPKVTSSLTGSADLIHLDLDMNQLDGSDSDY